MMAAGMKVSLNRADTEEACEDKVQGWSVELDHDLQTGKCHSLCSTSAAAFEFVLSCQVNPCKGELRDRVEQSHSDVVDSYVKHVGVKMM